VVRQALAGHQPASPSPASSPGEPPGPPPPS
jgi:hypothetical protein